MNRINGAKCFVYSCDGEYRGNDTCILRLEESQGIDILENKEYSSDKKVQIYFKEIKDINNGDKLVIVNKLSNKFWKNEYIVRNTTFDSDGIAIEDGAENILKNIKEISESEYNDIFKRGTSYIDWNNINCDINGEVVTKDKSFEYLCVDLINKIAIVKEGNFHPRGGADAGRDYIWNWPAFENKNINFLDLPDERWVMQCKYSEDISTKIRQTEIWDEIVKVLQHKPSHYILFTNRNITTSVNDWWEKIKEFDGRRSNFIPFTLHLVNKDDIERLLNIYTDIKDKFFSNN